MLVASAPAGGPDRQLPRSPVHLHRQDAAALARRRAVPGRGAVAEAAGVRRLGGGRRHGGQRPARPLGASPFARACKPSARSSGRGGAAWSRWPTKPCWPGAMTVRGTTAGRWRRPRSAWPPGGGGSRRRRPSATRSAPRPRSWCCRKGEGGGAACAGRLVLGEAALTRGGAAEIFRTPSGYRVDWAQDHRGHRPWSVSADGDEVREVSDSGG